jgi:hypothetical protein
LDAVSHGPDANLSTTQLLDNYGSSKIDATPDVNPQLADELGTVVVSSPNGVVVSSIKTTDNSVTIHIIRNTEQEGYSLVFGITQHINHDPNSLNPKNLLENFKQRILENVDSNAKDYWELVPREMRAAYGEALEAQLRL